MNRNRMPRMLDAALLLAIAMVLLEPRLAFAQVGPVVGPLASLTPTTLIVAGLGFLLAIATNMVNSGNLFGLLVTPQAWLPYLTLGVTFLGAFVPALTNAEPLTALSWTNAAIAGLTALIAYGAGHAVHANVQAGKVGAMKAKAAAKTLAALAGLVLLSQTQACIPGIAVVPVTPTNAAQVASCQSIATTHNTLVVGGFVLGGASTALGAISAIDTSSNAKTAYAISAAAVAAAAGIDTGVMALTSSQFVNGNCAAVVGNLSAKAPQARWERMDRPSWNGDVTTVMVTR